MKVGILTFPHAPSLGAMLQMGALYHVIEEMGHDVAVINYVSDKVNHKKTRTITPKTVLIEMLSKCFLKSAKPSYQEFEQKLKMYPSQVVSSTEQMSELSEGLDRIIVGSDQVWNPVVTGHDLNFYLEFCSEPEKKASYAASFGYMQADPEYEEKISELLKDFAFLSVREKDGQDIVKSLTGRKAELVLDPTLLVSADYLKGEMEPCHRKKKYVLFFCIKPSVGLREKAEQYADKYGYELVTVGGRIKERFDPRKHPEYGVGPKEFLGLINGAQCVFTNSFHGMAISVALHSDFFVEFSSDTNSRLVNLTEMLGMENRVVRDKTPLEEKIDYTHADEVLQRERKVSMQYLEKVLQ